MTQSESDLAPIQANADAEGFTARERAEALATAHAVFDTLPTAEQVARSKAVPAAVRELADKAAQLSDTELGYALRAVLPNQPGDARALLFALLGAIDGSLETVESQA